MREGIVSVIFLLLCVVAIVFGVRTMPAAAQQPKRVWVYDCFYTFSGAVAKLNTLGPEQAEVAKFAIFPDSVLGSCLVFPNGR